MSIGDDLRNARRSKGMTIERLSSVTKISPTVLRALEADDVAALPSWVFIRGFLKSYAREVGLDPEKTVAAFLAQSAPAEEPSLEHAGARRSDSQFESNREPIEVEPSTDLGQMLAVAVIVIAAVAYLGLQNRATPLRASSSIAASTSPAVVRTELPVATAGFSAPRPVATEADVLKLELAATGPCWISAAVDGEPRLPRLMNAGEQQTIGARESVTLRVGDPATLQLSINGNAAKPLGEAAQPVTVRITPQNAREYLAQ